MVDPILDAIGNKVVSVNYLKEKPSSVFSNLVRSFWKRYTDKKLPFNFIPHALPDACLNILLNQKDT